MINLEADAPATPDLEASSPWIQPDFDDGLVPEYLTGTALTTDAVCAFKATMKSLAPRHLPSEEQAVLAEQMVAGRHANAVLSMAEDLPADERARLQRVQAEGATAKEQLILTNWALALKCATKRQGKGVALDDLLQQANYGLVFAAEKYELGKGAKFSTFAETIIQQMLTKEIDSQGRSIRLSQGVEEDLRAIGKTRKQLREQYGREASDDEVAAEMDISSAKMQQVIGYSQPPVSLDAPAHAVPNPDEPTSSQLYETLPDTADSVEEVVIDHHLRADVQDLLAEHLTKQQREMVELTYGLNDRPQMTSPQIAAMHGMHPKRPNRIVNETRALLRGLAETAQLDDYLS